jgi:enediyne biosynthesis protein E4
MILVPKSSIFKVIRSFINKIEFAMKINLISIISLMLLVSCNQKKGDQNNTEKDPEIFELLDSQKSGVTFNNKITEDYNNFFAVFNYAYNGAGVAIGDINNDGLSDIFFTGNEVPCKLYLNKGNFKFQDITATANVPGGKGWRNGVVMNDVNGDGFIDIYVCRGGWDDSDTDRANLLYINQGNNTFKEQAKEYGIDDKGYSIMASFFDFDNDNDLDLYITNRPKEFFLGYEKVLAGKQKQDDLQRDKLYINNNGKFKEVGIQSGIKNNFGYGLGLVTTDINKDGFSDILVSNDYLEKDYFYINQGNGTFKEELEKHCNHTAMYGMGMDVVDFNNDGFEDIMQLDMAPEDYARSKTSMASMNTQLFKDMTDNGFYYQYMHNMLQLNRGNGYFSEIGQYSGISKTDWSWSCLGTDFDNDGFRDLYITNGFRRDVSDQDSNTQFRSFMNSPKAHQNTKEENAKHIISLFKENKIANYIFKNNGDLTFSKKNNEWMGDTPSFSNGAVVADLDNDGDMDIVVNNIEDKAFIYKNTSEKLKNNYIKIKLIGPKGNPSGIGAKVTISYEGKRQYQEFKTVRGYLSSVEPLVHFGLAKATKIDAITVQWNDGLTTTLQNIKANQMVLADYKKGIKTIKTENAKKTIFSDITQTAFTNPFIHREKTFDDFKDQILLPHKLSQEGPCLAVGDINRDGLEDFFVGGASDQSGEIYLQNAIGQFVAKTQIALQSDAMYEDVGATFVDVDGDKDLDLYVVSGSNEFFPNAPILEDRLYLNDGKGNFSRTNDRLPQLFESGSCVIPLDYDNDGDQDLFVGGRVVPKKYPNAPRSFLLKNTNGKFENATQTQAPELAKIGMVTSAVWSDIDGDKIKELIVVGEWMPISIFKIKNGIFKNVTHDFELDKTVGWWNKIVASDIDNDGDMDFVVGNLGLNYKFKASAEKPFTIFADDFDKNGTNDIFLTKYNNGKLVPIRGKNCSSQQLPSINDKFKTYTEFANADINQILGEMSATTLKYEAQEFASVILENDNGKLKLKQLPAETQFSVINSIEIDDFNADGIKDILIAGNKFEVEVETSRADASIGLLLLGTKSKNYVATSYLDSGFFVPYNAKDSKKIKLANGKKGVLVVVNNGGLKLFRAN